MTNGGAPAPAGSGTATTLNQQASALQKRLNQQAGGNIQLVIANAVWTKNLAVRKSYADDMKAQFGVSMPGQPGSCSVVLGPLCMHAARHSPAPASASGLMVVNAQSLAVDNGKKKECHAVLCCAVMLSAVPPRLMCSQSAALPLSTHGESQHSLPAFNRPLQAYAACLPVLQP